MFGYVRNPWKISTLKYLEDVTPWTNNVAQWKLISCLFYYPYVASDCQKFFINVLSELYTQ